MRREASRREEQQFFPHHAGYLAGYLGPGYLGQTTVSSKPSTPAEKKRNREQTMIIFLTWPRRVVWQLNVVCPQYNRVPNITVPNITSPQYTQYTPNIPPIYRPQYTRPQYTPNIPPIYHQYTSIYLVPNIPVPNIPSNIPSNIPCPQYTPLVNDADPITPLPHCL